MLINVNKRRLPEPVWKQIYQEFQAKYVAKNNKS